jgi:hypothetical protein
MHVLIDADLEELIGHIWITVSGHAKCSIGHQKDIYVHRRIVELVLNRPLKSTEHVHHWNENKLDNRRSNLVVCSNSYHKLLHARQDCINDGYNPDTHHYCSSCKQYHVKELFAKNRNAWNGVHNMCRISSNSARKEKGYGEFTWKERMYQQFRRALKKNLVLSLDKEGRRL